MNDQTITSKELEQWFINNFKDSYRKMQKEKLARMMFNMWSNYSHLYQEHYRGAQIWLKVKGQRDSFKRMLIKARRGEL